MIYGLRAVIYPHLISLFFALKINKNTTMASIGASTSESVVMIVESQSLYVRLLSLDHNVASLYQRLMSDSSAANRRLLRAN